MQERFGLKRWVNKARHARSLFVCYALLALFAISSPWWLSWLWSNQGWVQMNRARDIGASSSAIVSFEQALRLNRINQSAYRGAGMAYAIAGAEGEALRVWRDGDVRPNQLIEYGDKMWREGFPNIAFVYYRNAERLEPALRGEGYFAAGKVCQATMADLTVLSSVNRRFCRDYFARNDQNLILNGRFEYQIEWAWRGMPLVSNEQKAIVERDLTSGVSGASLFLDGRTTGSHGGLYQRIAIPPGTSVRFSGIVRIEPESEMQARVLYIEWSQDGNTHGTSIETVETSIDWHKFESAFTLPDSGEAWIQFYPVLFSGKGSIWIDDVRVEIVSDSEGSH